MFLNLCINLSFQIRIMVLPRILIFYLFRIIILLSHIIPLVFCYLLQEIKPWYKTHSSQLLLTLSCFLSTSSAPFSGALVPQHGLPIDLVLLWAGEWIWSPGVTTNLNSSMILWYRYACLQRSNMAEGCSFTCIPMCLEFSTCSQVRYLNNFSSSHFMRKSSFTPCEWLHLCSNKKKSVKGNSKELQSHNVFICWLVVIILTLSYSVFKVVVTQKLHFNPCLVSVRLNTHLILHSLTCRT